MRGTTMRAATIHTTTVLAAILLTSSAATAQKAQHWTGTAQANGAQIPAELQISAPGAGGSITGGFVNGHDVEEASSGTETNGHVVLHFSDYARTLEGDVTGHTFKGVLSGARMKAPVPVELHTEADGGKQATSFVAAPAAAGATATINGEWEIAVASSKGESAWTMRVSPFGGNGEIRAVIQRIDGDTGAMFGRFDPATGAYRVSRFGAFGRDFYAFKPQPDGTLDFSNLLQPEKPLRRSQNGSGTCREAAAAHSAHGADNRRRPLQTVPVLCAQPRRHTGGKHRSAVQEQGRHRRHRWQLVPQLPRRSTLPGGAVQPLPYAGA